MKHVYLSGGLGNQMFIYAFVKKLERLRLKVKVDISFYNIPNKPKLELGEAFSIKLEKYIKNTGKFTYYLMKITTIVFPFTKLFLLKEKEFELDERALSNHYSYLYCYFQTEEYFKDIKEEILDIYEFNDVDNSDYHILSTIINENNSISLHIRRGDYIQEPYKSIYGNICTNLYYKKSIKYINSKVDNPLFIVFTNDRQWVKENLFNDIDNIIFASDYLINKYPDWWDMSLMSQCKHNIIANSSFSWWGAYLNKNKDKIVVAPKKWINTMDAKQVCPEEWIRIEG